MITKGTMHLTSNGRRHKKGYTIIYKTKNKRNQRPALHYRALNGQKVKTLKKGQYGLDVTFLRTNISPTLGVADGGRGDARGGEMRG